MRAIPNHLLLDGQQAYVHQDTDTVRPRTPVPIYSIHDGETPFCHNSRCFCQRGKRAGAMLYRNIAAGKLLLAQFTAGTESRDDATAHTAGTDQSTRSVVTVPMVEGISELCQLYGHSWELTEHPDMKECVLCHVRGFCPGCAPVPPQGAQPFSCTVHTRREGERR